MPPTLAQLRDALLKERDAIKAEHARLTTLDAPTRALLGFTIYPLEIVTIEHRSRGRMNVILRGRDLASGPTSGIQAGDPVLLGPVTRADLGYTARCEGIDSHTVELRVDGVPEGKGPWAISKRLDFTVMQQQYAALERAERLRTPLAWLLLGHEPPYRPDPYDSPLFHRLNPSQAAAAALASGATELGLVHGPPGTGKTEVLVAILQALKERGERPWALADSNAAVDNLALRAHAAGLDVVRLGLSPRIASAAAPLTLEHRILTGPRAQVIETLKRQAIKADGPELAEILAAIKEEWSRAKKEILEHCDVIAMTLGTLHTRGEDLPPPRTAVVDEASQISEPAIWLLASKVKRILLAGDPEQLGPVVVSQQPILERSLLARLVEDGFPFPMLSVQYRMSDALLSLVNPTYDDRLTSAPQNAAIHVRDLPTVTPSLWTEGAAARWVDTAGTGLEEEKDGALASWYNPGELRLLKWIWARLKEAGVPAESVGVITPYTAQLLRVRQMLPELESGTVNAFQGREKEVILCSFVRSNDIQEVGFVGDPRRLNVAASRARRLWIGIGDCATLGHLSCFAQVISAVQALGGDHTAWEFLDDT